MSRRVMRTALPLLLMLCGLIGASSAADAAGGANGSGGVNGSAGSSGSSGSGGTGLAPASTSSGNGASTGTGAQPASGIVAASGNGITLMTRPVALLRHRLHFSGRVAAASPGTIVEIERHGRQTHTAWSPTAHGTVARDGSFTAIWPTDHIGRFSIRAVVKNSRESISRAAPPSPALTITVYRLAIVTTYGPGFWGSRTACGQVLHHGTLGVANRTLPCGTPVSLLWHGRTIVVPVIDRGPYANHADWDLTSATATALGITGTETVGATSLLP